MKKKLKNTASELGDLIQDDTELQIKTHAADLTQPGSGRKMIETASDAFSRIDILVNNVGGLTIQDIDLATASDCIESLQLNLVTAVECSHAVLPEFRKHGSGNIINICSVSANRGNGHTGFYPVAKAALKAYTISLAGKLAGEKIRGNSISPGPIDTPVWDRLGGDNAEAWRKSMMDRIPMGCLGLPDQIGKAAVFLASSQSEWTTGSDLVIDGGMLTA